MKNPDIWKEQIALENMIYKDPPKFEYMEVSNKDLLIPIFGLYPKLRPHNLENFVPFCSFYLKEDQFKQNFVRKILDISPTLIQRLYKHNVFTEMDIKESLMFFKRKFLCLFFKNNFEISNVDFDDDSIYEKYLIDPDLDQLIKYGFRTNSLEYCLKYDHVEDLQVLLSKNTNNGVCQWSNFEWSRKPKSLEFISFCSFFGSVKCFKYLIVSNDHMKKNMFSSIICGGSQELLPFLSISHFKPETVEHFFNIAALYNRISVFEYLNEYRAIINGKNNNFHIYCFLRHPLCTLHQRDTFLVCLILRIMVMM